MRSLPTAYEYLVSVVTKIDTDACILWPFQIDKGGYGHLALPLYFSGKKEKKKVSAHRLAYKVACGEWPMPEGMHSCDNRACFNPRHISAGTARDNNADKVAKGRQAKGEGAGLSKLTDELVAHMRQEYAEGSSIGQLAKRYGMSHSAMQSVIDGSTWKHIPNPVKERRPFRWDAQARQGRDATHCKRGHPFTLDNCLFWRGLRRCKICRHASERKVRLIIKTQKMDELVKGGAQSEQQRSRQRRTHCQRGHMLEGGDCYIRPRDGHRQCKVCKSDRGKMYYEQKKRAQ